MKKLSFLLVVVLAAFVFSGCAMVYSQAGFATLYTDVKTPAVAASVKYDADTASKMGQAAANNILGIILTGDASVEAAMRAGGITKVHHVDVKVTNILGLFATYTTIVYGE